jgi:hypothetical protein
MEQRAVTKNVSKILFHVWQRNKTSECNFIHSKGTKSSEGENARIMSENNADYMSFMPKIPFNINLFCKIEIMRLTAQVHHIRPGFDESGSWHILHDNVPPHSSGTVSKFLVKWGIPVDITHLFSPSDFFSPELKTAMEGMWFEFVSSMQQT